MAAAINANASGSPTNGAIASSSLMANDRLQSSRSLTYPCERSRAFMQSACVRPSCWFLALRYELMSLSAFDVDVFIAQPYQIFDIGFGVSDLRYPIFDIN